MNILIRTKLLMLSGALVLGGLAAGVDAAHAAPIHRPTPPTGPPPQITAIGGPGEVTVLSNRGWTPGATVRLEALTLPDLSTVLDTKYATVDQCGGFSEWPNQQQQQQCTSEYAWLDVHPSVGTVQIMVDQLGTGVSVPAQAQVVPMPTLTAQTVGGLNCSVPVNVTGSGFMKGATVHLQLMDTSWNIVTGGGNPGHPLVTDTTADQNGNLVPVTFDTTDASAKQNLRVIADEMYPWGQTQGSNIVSLC
jgi:hypothetical protein